MQIKGSVIFDQEMNSFEILMVLVAHSALSGWEVGCGDMAS